MLNEDGSWKLDMKSDEGNMVEATRSRADLNKSRDWDQYPANKHGISWTGQPMVHESISRDHCHT
jgi:hypothetical protein